MRRILSLLLAALIVLGPSTPSWAQDGVPGETPVAIGALTNAQVVGIATVATGAFVHSSTGGVLAGYLGHKLKLCDASTPVHCVVGYIKAAGAAEALGSELIANPSFDVNTGSWFDYPVDTTLASVAGGETNNALQITRASGTSQLAYQDLSGSVSANWLVKYTGYVKSGTSGNEAYIIDSNDGVTIGLYGSAAGTSSASWVLASFYGTLPATIGTVNFSLTKNSATAGTMLFDTVSAKRVTAPSATGVTIGATKAPASAQTWSAIETGFNPNSATFSYTVSKVHANPVVAGAAIASTAAHIQTASPALVWLDAIDLSVYASTATASHYICLYDSSNRALCAFAGAAGAGEGLSATEIFTDPVFENAGVWTAGAGWTVNVVAGKAAATAASTSLTQTGTNTGVSGGLYKSVIACDSFTSGTWRALIFGNSIGYTDVGTKTGYNTHSSSGATGVGYNGSALTATFTDISLKQVTTGPATGLDLRSTGKLGGTQVPVFTTSGFNGNAVIRWAVYYIGS